MLQDLFMCMPLAGIIGIHALKEQHLRSAWIIRFVYQTIVFAVDLDKNLFQLRETFTFTESNNKNHHIKKE